MATGHRTLAVLRAMPHRMRRPSNGSVHVWQIPIPGQAADIEALEKILTVMERRRAEVLLVPHAKAEFVATRASLRWILASYLEVRPAEIDLRLGAHGKPRLGNESRLCFNVSHAREMSLCAVAWDCQVGIDIEAHLPGAPLDRLADRVCAPLERQQLQATTGLDRVATFYRCWSKKEAIFKAVGGGLSLPALPLMDVLSRPGSLIMRGEMQALTRGTWHIHDIEIDSRHSAAVAFRSDEAGKKVWIT